MNLHAIRSRAERLLGTLELETVPVPVEKIAKKLGLDVVLAELGGDVSGMLVTDGEGRRICVQRSDTRTRRRFTIAHEIGHHHLGHQFTPGEQVHVDRGHLIRMRSPKSSTGEDLVEVEANQFAAALLMPEQALRTAVERAGGAPVTDTVVAQLAIEFDVSEQAMTIRLTVLRLL